MFICLWAVRPRSWVIYLLSTAPAGPGQEDNLEKGVGVGVVTLKHQASALHMSYVREHAHKSTNIAHSFHTYHKQISVLERCWSYKAWKRQSHWPWRAYNLVAKTKHEGNKLIIYTRSWLETTSANRIQRRTFDFHIRKGFWEEVASESNLKSK